MRVSASRRSIDVLKPRAVMPAPSTSTACLPRHPRARFPPSIVQKEDEAMKERGRDLPIERMLGQTLRKAAHRTGATANDCPDAEILAAWTEGTLRHDEQVMVESHIADCARCQTHLAAMTRMASSVDRPPAQEHGFRLWPWAVPIAGAVAAAGLWLIVQPPRTPPLPEPKQVEWRASAPKSPPPSPAQDSSLRSEGLSKDEAVEQKRQLFRERRDQAAQSAAPGSAPPAVAAPEAPPRAVEESLAVGAASGNATQTFALAVRRMDDGRVVWETRPDDISARLTAGASPSPATIWLVGKSGLVLLSTDGRLWRRLPFPDPADLTAIEAANQINATVTTADARTFTTSDGGLTWQRR